MQGCFTLHSPSGILGTRRLPFGWTWSPILADSYIYSLLAPLRALLPSVFQYIDDLLLWHPDPHFLTFCTHFAAHLLTSAGFLLNAKRQFVPSPQIDWLGKVLQSNPHPLVFNHSSRFSQLFSTQLSLFLLDLSQCRILILILRTLGLFSMAVLPSLEVAIFLALVYSLSRHSHIWQPLLQSFFLVQLPATTKAPPPPLTFPPVFVDAAPDPPFYRVGTNHNARILTAVRTPFWVRSQNQAELYGLFHCIRQAGLRKLTPLCLVTDSSASYFATLSGRSSAHHTVFLRLLRRIWRTMHQFRIHLSLALTPSENNAADAVSRLHQLPPELSLTRSLELSALEHPFQHSAVVPRFWHRSSYTPPLPFS